MGVTLPTVEEIADTIGFDHDKWQNHCHEVSLAVVQSGILAPPGPETCRVVRGFASKYGIGGQHSWVALGRPFDSSAIIVDVTAHTWGEVDGIIVSTVKEAYDEYINDRRGHVAHGYQPGEIWEFGKPRSGDGAYFLDVAGLSDSAKTFLGLLGPLNDIGWLELVTYPHGGWPATEICEAIVEQVPRASTLLPIDVVGHATDLNPGELYW